MIAWFTLCVRIAYIGVSRFLLEHALIPCNQAYSHKCDYLSDRFKVVDNLGAIVQAPFPHEEAGEKIVYTYIRRLLRNQRRSAQTERDLVLHSFSAKGGLWWLSWPCSHLCPSLKSEWPFDALERTRNAQTDQALLRRQRKFEYVEPTIRMGNNFLFLRRRYAESRPTNSQL